MTPMEQLFYSTVRLVTYRKGVETGSGTGFFWGISEGLAHEMLVATNKHVLEGADQVRLTCHTADVASPDRPSGRFADITCNIYPDGIFYHPDPSVDLCAFGFSALSEQADAIGHTLFIRSLGAHLVPPDWQCFQAIEEVLMIGCPNGLLDHVNVTPIARRGITATPLSQRFNGAEEFLVDMACFPGSSGSPIMIYDRGRMCDPAAGTVQPRPSQLYFVGILYSGPVIDIEGKLVLDEDEAVTVESMMHLGQAIRSTEMLKIDEVLRKHLGPAPAA